jgi:2-methylcitrate dehydratase PrpD
MTHSNLTDEFIGSLFDLAQTTYPDHVIIQAKKCTLDYVGVTLAGAKMLKAKGDRLLDYLGSTTGNSTAIGFNQKTDVQTAAMLNGLSSHVAELDDGHRFGMMHPGAPIISALFPVVENELLNGTDFIRGLIVGYEAALRIASAMQPGLKQRGHHATGVCGAIGSALGIGAALRFTERQMKDALAAAATGASGLLRVIKDGSELKPYNVGHAALNGLWAAHMARAGFSGPNDVLSGEAGFISILTDSCKPSYLKRGDSEPLAIEKVYMKPYAACRHCHPPIEAALKIRASTGVKAEDIREIRVISYQAAVYLHDHIDIPNPASAKMSTPYSVAVALVSGKAGMAEFSPECISDSFIASLTRKVKVCSDEALTALTPHKRPAIVEATTHSNRIYIARVDLPKGEPETPLSKEELQEKFLSLALYRDKSLKNAKAIMQTVWNLETDISKLFVLL